MLAFQIAFAFLLLGGAFFAALGIGLRTTPPAMRFLLVIYLVSVALGLTPLPVILRYATTLIGLLAVLRLLRLVRHARIAGQSAPPVPPGS